MKIGFFDSGVGGLTILKAVREYLPEYDYVFFADTEHVPYGEKPKDEIYELTKAGITRLFQEGALLVIVACNTASAEALRELQETFLKEEYPDRKVLGVIIPTIEILEEHHAKRPLLIGTRKTIQSKKYTTELQKIGSDMQLVSQATPELVPLIEIGEIESAFREAKIVIDKWVGEIDAIILGCTHYTLLKDLLKAEYRIPVVSQDEVIPQKLKSYLDQHEETRSKLSTRGSVDVILSKESEYLNHIKKELL